MKKTGLALLALVATTLALEALALKSPHDDWWTITAVMRALPDWAILTVGVLAGILIDHFWIRGWNR